MTAPNGHAELIPFEAPGAPEPQALAPATWTGGAMAGWREELEETRRVVRSFQPSTPVAIPEPTAHRPGGPTPQLATAVANMELALRAVLIGAAVLVVVLLAVRVVGWLA